MVKLTGLPEERFPAYRARLAKDYARDKVAAGVWSPEEAPRRAEADLDGTLPEGVNTRDHFLYAKASSVKDTPHAPSRPLRRRLRNWA